jgi:hypothetical protein
MLGAVIARGQAEGVFRADVDAIDIHMAIGSALSRFDNVLRPHFTEGTPLVSGGVTE